MHVHCYFQYVAMGNTKAALWHMWHWMASLCCAFLLLELLVGKIIMVIGYEVGAVGPAGPGLCGS